MYWLPSASHICAPSPRTMNGGSPPTARKARTGEFTPPGNTASARRWSSRDLSWGRDIDPIITSARRYTTLHASLPSERRGVPQTFPDDQLQITIEPMILPFVRELLAD